MRVAARVQRDRAEADPRALARLVVAADVEHHLVAVDVGVVVGHRDRQLVVVDLARQEVADHEVVALEDLVHRRRLVDLAGDRHEVLDVERVGVEAAVPADHVERVGRVGHPGADDARRWSRCLTSTSTSVALGQERLGRAVQVALAVRRVLEQLPVAGQVALRRRDVAVRLDRVELARLGRHPAVRGRARDDHVVAGAVGQHPEHGLDGAGAGLDVDALVADRVAVVRRRVDAGDDVPDPDVAVAQHQPPAGDRRPCRVGELVQLEVPRLQRVVRASGSGRAAPTPRCRRSPTARRGGRAARSPRRTPPRPSAPRSRACRRGRGAGCAASAGRRPLLGSTPCLATLDRVCHSYRCLRGAGSGRRRRDLPAGTPRCTRPPRRTAPGSAEDGADLVGTLRAAGHRPAAGARASAARCRSSSPAAPASSAGRSGSARARTDTGSPASSSRCATWTTWPATRAGSSPSTPATTARRRVRRLRRAAARREPTAAGWPRRRRRRGRAAAEVPHRRARGVGVPVRRGPGRPGSTRRWTASRRSSARPACTTPSGTPATDGFEHHGFLNVLLATRRPSTAPRPDDVVDVLEQRDGAALGCRAAERRWTCAGARRWFTSFGSCTVAEPLADLRALGLDG